MPTTISQLGILLRHSLPLCLGASLQYLISLTSIFSVGHIGTDQLSAVALSAMFANVTAFSIGFGASSALETLCSQAFTLEPATLGHHLNRSILVMIVFTLPVTILWLYMEKLMLLLGQEAQVAYFAGEYILVLVPGILPVLIFECMKRFLQAQGIMSGVFVVVSFSAPINIFLQWLFIGPFDLGFRGAALATCVTYYLQPIILFVYAKFFTTGLHHYHGWNWKQVFDTEKLMLFLKLAIPGAAMICSESWAFELVTLSASMLGSTALAAQVVFIY